MGLFGLHLNTGLLVIHALQRVRRNKPAYSSPICKMNIRFTHILICFSSHQQSRSFIYQRFSEYLLRTTKIATMSKIDWNFCSSSGLPWTYKPILIQGYMIYAIWGLQVRGNSYGRFSLIGMFRLLLFIFMAVV